MEPTQPRALGTREWEGALSRGKRCPHRQLQAVKRLQASANRAPCVAFCTPGPAEPPRSGAGTCTLLSGLQLPHLSAPTKRGEVFSQDETFLRQLSFVQNITFLAGTRGGPLFCDSYSGHLKVTIHLIPQSVWSWGKLIVRNRTSEISCVWRLVAAPLFLSLNIALCFKVSSAHALGFLVQLLFPSIPFPPLLFPPLPFPSFPSFFLYFCLISFL